MITHDPITRVLSNAEALETLARLLPRDQGGLAHLLELVAADAKDCGEELNDLTPGLGLEKPRQA